ncbi:MAG TPA: CBS domain-containing protein [bacterium]|nr:CBS domain-containing protein [bacterium]
MKLQERLAVRFAADHPGEAAAVLEPRPPEDAARALAALPPAVAAQVIRRMAPAAAARAAEHADAAEAGRILGHLTTDTAIPVLRRISPARRQAVADALPREHAEAVRAVLAFPAGTAGASMDPRHLALPADLTVKDTLEAMRRDPEHAHYNVYVVDRDQRLVGVLNLQEILAASPGDRLAERMKSPEHRLDADAGHHAILRHPGWRHVHSLPVVDRDGRYLGALRYRALRGLEAERDGGAAAPELVTVRALGDLFGAGLGGLLGAFAASVPSRAPSAPRDEPESTP